MQVPPNYSGHAIVDGEERPLGELCEAENPVEPADADAPTPRFDDLPRVSELGDSRRHPSVRTVPATFEELSPEEPPTNQPRPMGRTDQSPAVPSASPSPPQTASRPAVFDLSRFPFGHGIGFEELLILGLILFLLHESGDCEDRGDLDETVILLGFLLLLG
jgi:hypothetical protein